MPLYGFSSGLSMLQSGLKDYTSGIGAAADASARGDVIRDLAAGRYTEAEAGLAKLGDLPSALSLDALKRKQEGDISFANIARQVSGGGSGGLDSLSSSGGPQVSEKPHPTPDAQPSASIGGISPLAPQAARQFISDGTIKNPIGAAAFAAGFQAESKFDPSQVAKGDGRDGSDAVNIGQWNGSRAVDFRNFYQANKLDPNDPKTGLMFGKYELTTKPEYAGVREALNNAKTPEEAQAAAISFWKPRNWTSSDPTTADDYQRRVGITKAVYASMQNSPGTVQASPNAAVLAAAPPGWRAPNPQEAAALDAQVSPQARALAPAGSRPVQVASAAPGVPMPDTGVGPVQGPPYNPDASAAPALVPGAGPAAGAAPAVSAIGAGIAGPQSVAQAGPVLPAAPIAPTAALSPQAAPGPDATVQAAARGAPGIPPQMAAGAAQSLARTLPGSQERRTQLANMMLAAGRTSDPVAARAYVQMMMDVQKQQEADFKAQTRILTPQEAQASGLPPAGEGAVWTIDGNGKPTRQAGAEVTHILKPGEAKAQGLPPAVEGSVWSMQNGKPVLVSSGKSPTTYQTLFDPEKRAAQGFGPLPGTTTPGQVRSNGQPFLPSDPTHLRVDSDGKVEPIDKGGVNVTNKVDLSGASQIQKDFIGRLSTGYTAYTGGVKPQLDALNTMQEKINEGMINGWGPGQQAAEGGMALLTKVLNLDPKLMSNTQAFKIAAAQEYARLAKQTFPQRVTNADILVAKIMSGGDPSYTTDALNEAIDMQRRIALKAIDQQNENINRFKKVNPDLADQADVYRVGGDELPGTVKPTVGRMSKMPQISSASDPEYKKLRPGDHYIDSDGHEAVRGGQ